MRYRSLWILVAVAVALLSFANWGGRAQVSARKNWEYKVVVAQYGASPASLSEEDLNKLGAEGWELVETRSLEFPRGAAGQYRTDYYFKRLR